VEEADRVNSTFVDKENDYLVGDMAIVVRSEETAKRWEAVLGGASHVPGVDACMGPHDLIEGVEMDLGSGVDVMGKEVGPLFFQPKALRTKKGDIPLFCVKRGGISSAPESFDNGPRGPAILAQKDSTLACPNHERGNSLPPIVCSQTLPLPSTDRCMRGRTKKVVKKSIPYPPGNKFFKYRKVAKGGAKNKKKKLRRGDGVNLSADSCDSDPIVSTLAEGREGQRYRVSDWEGIGLEVVLSSSPEHVEDPIEVSNPGLSIGGGGGCNSGLGDLLGAEADANYVMTTHGVMVDKERGDAQHVIDIQEDLGMTFKGQGDEEVERCVAYEERDRKMKNDLVHSHGYQ
jgi:hypothetical protein